MSSANTKSLERVRYWQGQLLSSGDLQTQLRVDEELRRLHNGAAHHAYGVAVGLGWADTPAKVDQNALLIPCGLAYDCAGRPLILKEQREVELPPDAKDGDTLLLSYDSQSPDGIILQWVPRARVNPANGIAIARLSLNSGHAVLDKKFRAVIARPLARPPLATGITVPGGTAWQTWRLNDEEVGVQVLVDTTASGFTRKPHYFAEAIPKNVTPGFNPAWLASIADPSPDGFTLQLLMRRIARESLVIVDPKTQVTAVAKSGQPITVDAGDRLKANDIIARLLPLAERASTITKLENGTATLDIPLEDLTEAKQVAFGNIPRVVKVTNVLEIKSTFEVTVAKPGNFAAEDVIVNLSVAPNQTQPAEVTAVDIGDDDITLELASPISGLQENHQLGVARHPTDVTSISADKKTIEVSDPGPYQAGMVIVRLGKNVNMTSPVRIDANDGGKIKLASELGDLVIGSSVGVVEAESNVLLTNTNVKEQKVDVDHPELFLPHDIVTKPGNPISEPVRINKIAQSGRLSLSAPITGLKENDTLIAADFSLRATVTEVEGTTVVVADPSLFPAQSYVAAIDDLLTATEPARVTSPTPNLTLNHAIEGLEAGKVIGLCRFPPTVTVKAPVSDGAVTVDGAGIQTGDLVMLFPATVQAGRPQLFVVAEAQANIVRLAGKVPDVGDRLAVANTRGVIEVAPIDNSAKVTIQGAGAKRVRAGDYLAELNENSGWIQPLNNKPAVALVISINNNSLVLSSYIDGLLPHDTVGLASLVRDRMLIRLKEAAVLNPGDEVVILGIDRRRGTSESLAAHIALPPVGQQVVLSPEGSVASFEFRPQDILASVLFVGSPLRLIKDLDLYVSWIACGDADHLPRPCAEPPASSDPCANAKESII